jgi:hypothetical protein
VKAGPKNLNELLSLSQIPVEEAERAIKLVLLTSIRVIAFPPLRPGRMVLDTRMSHVKVSERTFRDSKLFQ